MNRVRFFPAAVVSVAIGLILLTGCDSDDNAVNTQPTETAGTDSSLVSTTVGDRMMAAPFQSIELSSQLLAQQGVTAGSPRQGALAATGDGDDHIVITAIGDCSFADGWHVFTFEAIAVDNITADTVDIAGVDSVQVLVDGQPVFAVGDGDVVDGLLARAHVDWSARNGEGDGAVHHSIDVGAAPLEVDTLITINGFAHDTLTGFEETDSARCNLHLAYDLTIDNLQVYASASDDDCPEAGDIAVTVTIDAGCVETQTANPDSIQIDGTWTVTAHVNSDGTVTVTFTNGLLFWRVTEACGSATSGLSRNWWTSAVRSGQSSR